MKLNRWETNGLRLICILIWGALLFVAMLAPLSLFYGTTEAEEYVVLMIIFYILMPLLLASLIDDARIDRE